MQAGLVAGGALAIALIAGGGCHAPTSAKVVTEPACAIERSERELADRVARSFANKIPELPRLEARLACRGALVAVEGSTIRLRAEAVHWIQQHSRGEDQRRDRLAFLIARELAPRCNNGCSDIVSCERTAEGYAAHHGAFDPTALLELLAEARTWTSVDAHCLQTLALRVSNLGAVAEEAQRGVDDPDRRRELHRALARGSDERQAINDELARCAVAASAPGEPVCVSGGVAALRTELARVPDLRDMPALALRSPLSRWRDDASVHLALDAAPGFWQPLDPPEGVSGRLRMGGVTRLYAGFEAGLPASVGLRLGVMDDDQDLLYSAELVATRPLWLIERRVALVGALAIGGVYVPEDSGDGGSFVASAAIRIAVKLSCRLHLGAGVEGGILGGQVTTVMVPVTLDVHLGGGE